VVHNKLFCTYCWPSCLFTAILPLSYIKLHYYIIIYTHSVNVLGRVSNKIYQSYLRTLLFHCSIGHYITLTLFFSIFMNPNFIHFIKMCSQKLVLIHIYKMVNLNNQQKFLFCYKIYRKDFVCSQQILCNQTAFFEFKILSCVCI
jgi:hypothetical protein